MNEHHLRLSVIPVGHPGEGRRPPVHEEVTDLFRRAAAEAELVRTRLCQLHYDCDDVAGEPA
jgi:hypothetical protein